MDDIFFTLLLVIYFIFITYILLYCKHEIFLLKHVSLQTVAVLIFPFVRSENIDCKGKAFHCVNSTHFKICVDFGGGVSKTVDDFQIPCPTNTVCRDIHKFECEQLVTTTLAPLQQSDETTEDEELSFTPSFKEVNVMTLLPEYKTEGKLESSSDNLRNTESSFSVTSEDTTNLISSTTLDVSSIQTTLSSENTIRYNKQSDLNLSDIVTVPYTSESGLNLVTNSDEFSTTIAKIKKVNDPLLNSLVHNSSNNNRDHLSLKEPIQTIEGSTTEQNVNIEYKNLYSDTTDILPISTLNIKKESLSTPSEILKNDSPYFTENEYVTNDPNIFTIPVVALSSFSVENIANHPSLSVLNPAITTESYNTDIEQTTESEHTTESNDGTIINSSLNNSKNNLIKDSVNSFKDNLSTYESTSIYETTKNIFSKYSINLTNTGFTTTDISTDKLLSDKKETLAVLSDFPSTMSVIETFDNTNEENIKSATLTSTTPYYKNDSLITLITSNKYEKSFEQNVTSVPDSIDLYTENVTKISVKQYPDNFTESETTTPYIDLLSPAIFNSTVALIESLPMELLETSSDNIIDKSDLKSSKIEIPIKLHNSNKTAHNNEMAADNLLLVNVDHTSYEKNLSKATDDNDVIENETTLLNENNYIDIPLVVEIYNTSNSSGSNIASLQETTINLSLTNVTPLNISVDITSETTLQYSSLPEQSTTTVVSEEIVPTISVTETNFENNIQRVVGNTEVTENKTTLVIGNTLRVTTSLIEEYNSTDTSETNVASFQETTIKLTSQNDATSLNIDVDLNSKTTLQYTSFREQSTTRFFSELHQNNTNSYSVVPNAIISIVDTSTENNMHNAVDDRNILENKTILLNENVDINTTSLKKTYSTTESSESILSSLVEAQNNLTPLIDVTPSNIGVDLNSRATLQYIPSSQQSTTNVITTPTIPDFKDNKMLSTTVSPPNYSSTAYTDIAYKDKKLDDVPYSNNTSNAEESVILINNSNNEYLNLHSSSFIVSTKRSSINPSTKQALNTTDDQIYKNNQKINVLNMTTNSYVSYANNEKNQSQLDTMFTGKIKHTTSLNVEFNISNVSINKVNTTENSNLKNVDQSSIVIPLLKREIPIIPFNENVDKIETSEIITTTEATNSHLFSRGNKESTNMYPVTENSSLTTNPHVYHKENVTKVVSSQKKNDLKRSNEKDETSFNTDINLPYIFPNTLDSVSDVYHNISRSEAVFNSYTIPETTSFATKIIKTTSHKTTSNKYNSNVTNTNYVNSNNIIATVNIIDDLHNNFHNVQKITERTSNTSTLDTENIRSEVNETAGEGFILSKIFKLSTNHSSLKYENTSLSKQNETTSNKKVSLLETNMNQNMSLKNDNNLIKKDSQQNTDNYDNDIEKQPITISILRNSSSESILNISNLNNQTTQLASQFSCFNRDRGKYSDKNNCSKFYICIGKLQPLHGMCPLDTVFSEINKHCTKNLSHCIRNIEFKCLSSGRFISVLSDKFYYICAKNLGGYIRFKLQCQKGYHLNKENISCVSDFSSIENVSKTNTDVSTDEKVSKEFKQSEKYTKQFHCIKEGKFEHSDDCRKYFVCKKGSKSQFRRKVEKCDSDEVFDKEKQKCVDSDTYEC